MSTDEHRIPFDEIVKGLSGVFQRHGLSAERAELIARTFTQNTCDGILSHGIARVPLFIEYIQNGSVKVDAEPEKLSELGMLEQWDAHFGPGIVNAHFAMDRAINLAKTSGSGIVALRNSNHWLRGGTYGLKAAEAGCIGICWTNTMALMPPWGAAEKKIGNNPLVLAAPRGNGAPFLLDMAMSQFSMGKIGVYQDKGEELPIPGGFNTRGELTTNPGEIVESGRSLAIGYWKGSGLAVMLDLVATLLSQGRSTRDLTSGPYENGVSQIFMAFDTDKLGTQDFIRSTVENLVDDLHQTAPLEGNSQVRYPGEGTAKIREANLRQGIPVDPETWKGLLAL